jgi:hypothetical protein
MCAWNSYVEMPVDNHNLPGPGQTPHVRNRHRQEQVCFLIASADMAKRSIAYFRGLNEGTQ